MSSKSAAIGWTRYYEDDFPLWTQTNSAVQTRGIWGAHDYDHCTVHDTFFRIAAADTESQSAGGHRVEGPDREISELKIKVKCQKRKEKLSWTILENEAAIHKRWYEKSIN